jgi:hypothetical protein
MLKEFKNEMECRMRSPESKWTENCHFNSIEKYDREGTLKKVI